MRACVRTWDTCAKIQDSQFKKRPESFRHIFGEKGVGFYCCFFSFFFLFPLYCLENPTSKSKQKKIFFNYHGQEIQSLLFLPLEQSHILNKNRDQIATPKSQVEDSQIEAYWHHSITCFSLLFLASHLHTLKGNDKYCSNYHFSLQSVTRTTYPSNQS